MGSSPTLTVDALVIGGGIAGLQTALDLAEQDFTVAVVEKDATIGGKMIRLSKVFPTLDCASCITTPKMAAAAHHVNITLFTYCDLLALTENGSGVKASVRRRPRYVDEQKCIGCRKCEYICPVYVADEEQGGFSARKAIAIPFSNAIPQVAVLDEQNCLLCGQCEKVCPTGAVDYLQGPQDLTIEAGTAVLTTGFEIIPLEDKVQYGRGTIPNVVTALQMERLLAPHGPYARVLRPSDGREPDSIAFIQCAGSRDLSLGHAVLLPGVLHVCHQAGHAAFRRPAAGGYHHLLHGHPRLRQGLRAVLPERPGHGYPVRQGQGGYPDPGGCRTGFRPLRSPGWARGSLRPIMTW